MNTELLSIIGIPKNYWEAKLAFIPDCCAHKKVLEKYCDDVVSNVQTGQGLYLYGDYSMGKSAGAAILLKAAAAKRIAGRWVRAKELTGVQIEKRLNPNTGEELFDEFRECPLLVIDEFQLRETVKYSESLVEDVVRYRVDKQLSTVVTSNVVLPELKANYPAFYAVLQEALYPVHFKGHDFREPKKGRVL